MIAALDALTVMETMARVIPTTATTNTYTKSTRQLNNKNMTLAVILTERTCRGMSDYIPSKCQTAVWKVTQVNGPAHQDVKSDKDGAGSKADLGTSWWKLPHQEHQESYIWHQQQQVPEAHPRLMQD